MIWPAKVGRSTMAAQSRLSVKVLVQPEKGSLEAIAIAERSSRSVRSLAYPGGNDRFAHL
jgi:negative regulator of sigma E activity